MNEDNAINFLAMTGGEELTARLQMPAAALARYLEDEFPTGGNLAPDSQEAAEAAELDERRERFAAATWRELRPHEQERLLETLPPNLRDELRDRLEGRLY